MTKWMENQYVLSPVPDPLWHGADKKKVEFRFPELKSSLRFWWRAVNLYKDPVKMHEDEADLFGSTDGQSPIQFIPHGGTEPKLVTAKRMKKWEDICFKVKYFGEDEARWEYYQTLLKLASYLGGLGEKSRKGKGVYCLNEERQSLPKNAVELSNLIKNALDVVSNTEWKLVNKTTILKSDMRKINTSYAMLRSINVFNDLPKKLFESKVKDATDNGKDDRKEIENQIEAFSPLIIISAYPSPQDDRVYPVISQFNFIKKTGYVDLEKYNKLVNAYKCPFF